MKFTKVYEIEQSWSEYDKKVAECQLDNYGCIYIDEYGVPIDNKIEVELQFQYESEKKCCICGKRFTGWGNNPWPVKEEGECCNECNRKKVIPARIEMMIIRKEE